MLYYYARPIDFAPESGRSEAVEAIVESVLPAVYFPSRGWSIKSGTIPEPGLQLANLEVLDLCHGLVAYLPAGVPTIGVIVEILRAAPNIPTLVLTTTKESWALSALREMYPLLEVVEIEPIETLPNILEHWYLERKQQ